MINEGERAEPATADSDAPGEPDEARSPTSTRRAMAEAGAWVKHMLEDYSAKLGQRYVQLLGKKQGRVTQSLSGVPRRMHRVANETRLVLELIDDFADGTYRQIPWHSIAVLAGAVLYSVSPTDVVPDVLPVLGVLDDMAVIAVAVRLVQKDLRAYCRFKGYPESDYF